MKSKGQSAPPENQPEKQPKEKATIFQNIKLTPKILICFSTVPISGAIIGLYLSSIGASLTNTVYFIIGTQIFLSILVAVSLAFSISKPIRKLTKGLNMLAAGETDIPSMGIHSKCEIGQMRKAFRSIISSIQKLNEDSNLLIEAAKEGQLAIRADEQSHVGSYRSIIEGFNATLDAMSAPISESAAVLGALSEGNLSASVEGDFHGDFAIIKDALNSTMQTLKSYIDEISQVLGDMSTGILTVSINSEFKGDFAALKLAINKSIEAFNGVLMDINIAAEEVAQGAVQLSSGSQAISNGASEQASAIEELTATITQIAEQTRSNAESANEASELSQKARKDATGGNEKMNILQEAMQEINASSASISKIIKVIDDIAFQTNILALNAAVEAARAGAHGKGFAVVAEEVRELAGRSAKAAKETADLIEGSIQKTAAGTQIADEAVASLADIVSGVEKTVELSGHIATASNEQATGISQVNKGIEQLSEVVQSSSATAQEAAASSEELAAQADQLKQMVGRFRLNGEGGRTVFGTIEKYERAPIADDDLPKAAAGSMPGSILLSDDEFGKF